MATGRGLSGIFEHGSKVLVPHRLVEPENSPDDTTSNSTAYGGCFPININTTSRNTLTALPGIGETKAQAIIDYRTENGPFIDPEQLMDVSGIGPATYEKLKDLITIVILIGEWGPGNPNHGLLNFFEPFFLIWWKIDGISSQIR